MGWKLPARPGLSGVTAFALIAGTLVGPAASATTASWNGYHWARTGLLSLQTVNRTSSAWTDYFAPALTGWSAASQFDMVGSRGTYSSSCNPVFATIQVCNGSYGSNGWLGYANVWLSGGHIVQATVRLNDSYFSSARYNTPAWRSSVLCQELGHTIGLAHNNTIRSDLNTGSCMDYSNDPDGGTTYGASNVVPGSMDFDGLNIIYAHQDSTQLAGTMPTGAGALMTVPSDLTQAGEGLYLEGWHDPDHNAGAVPEPSAWVMLIAGFGMTAGAMRRRQRYAFIAARPACE